MKRKTLLVVIAIIIVIGATAGGVYYYTKSDSTAPQDSEPESTVPGEEEPTSTIGPWTVTISNARTEETVTEPPSSGVAFTYLPPTDDEIFLLVNFELEQTAEAELLDVEDILVTVDATHEFSPVGWAISSGEANIGRFSGTIGSGGATVQVMVNEGTGIIRTVYGNIHATDPFIFVYVLPRTYLDATHNLQLQISGFSEGLEFTV
jgi:hypothetical protein